MDYRREIDGLRAVAVMPVILFHAGFQLCRGGFVGVDVFFVISGYLISNFILTELEQENFSLINFYERRARRILPALFLVMLTCLPFAWLWLFPSDMIDFSQSIAAVAAFVSNILFYKESGYFEIQAELKPLLHTWSLAVEEQFYLFFPLLLVFTWKRGKPWILGLLIVLCLLSLGLAQWGSSIKPLATFYLIPARGWELLSGAILAFCWQKDKASTSTSWIAETCGWLGLAFILYAIFAFDKQTPFPSLYTLLPTVGTILILRFASQQTAVGKLLGTKLFVGIGLVSYSAYLWHQPLFAFAKQISIEEPSTLLLTILAIASIGLSYFSWKYIEKPFRDRERFKRKNIFIAYGIFSFVFIALGLTGYLSNGMPNRFDKKTITLLESAKDKNPRQRECSHAGNTYPRPEDSCKLGASNTKVVGILMGDSHADSISHPLEQQLAKHGLTFRSRTYINCPPVLGVYSSNGKSISHCYDYNKQTAEYVVNNDNVHNIVLIARWSLYLERAPFDNKEGGRESIGERFIDVVKNGKNMTHEETQRRKLVKEKYQTTLQKYLDAGKKIILVYPVPEVGFNVPRTMARKMTHQNSPDNFILTTSYARFLERNKEVLNTFDTIPNHPNLIRIKPSAILCDTLVKNRCITDIEGKPLYFDDNHLNNYGASLVVNEIIKHITE